MRPRPLRFKALHPLVRMLLIGTVIVSMVQSMCAPFFAVYLSRSTTMSIVEIGLLIGFGSLGGTVGGFIGGTLSDLFGRTRVMIGSLFVQAFVYAGYTYVRNPAAILVLILLSGFFGAFFAPTAKAMIGDLTADETRIRVYAWQYVGNNIGYAIGPLLGAALGLVGGAVPFQAMSIVYLCYVLMLAVLVRRYPVKTRHVQEGGKPSIQDALRVVRADRILIIFIIGGFLTTVIHGRWSTPLSMYLSGNFSGGDTIFSALLTTNAVAVITFQPVVSKWMGRMSPFQNIVIGAFFTFIGVGIFAVSANWLSFVSGMVAFTVGEVCIVPSEYAIIDQITPASLRGAYFGATSFTQLGNFAGPWLFNLLLARFGGSSMFAVMGLCTAFSIMVYFAGHKMRGAVKVRAGQVETADV